MQTLTMAHEREITAITADELRAMTNEEFLNHLRRYPYPSQMTDPEARQFSAYWLAHLSGKRYQERGDKTAFTTSIY